MMRAQVYRWGGFWLAEVYEPDEDGYLVKLTAERTFASWREAIAWGTGDSLSPATTTSETATATVDVTVSATETTEEGQ